MRNGFEFCIFQFNLNVFFVCKHFFVGFIERFEISDCESRFGNNHRRKPQIKQSLRSRPKNFHGNFNVPVRDPLLQHALKNRSKVQNNAFIRVPNSIIPFLKNDLLFCRTGITTRYFGTRDFFGPRISVRSKINLHDHSPRPLQIFVQPKNFNHQQPNWMNHFKQQDFILIDNLPKISNVFFLARSRDTLPIHRSQRRKMR